MFDKEIVNYIWRGYGSLAIVKEFSPTGDRAERELLDAIAETRSAIEKLIQELPGIIEAALRTGNFTAQQIIETVMQDGQGLVPRFNVECLVSGIAAKIDKEGQTAREAAEKAAADAKKAAIHKQIDDATAALRAMGAQL